MRAGCSTSATLPRRPRRPRPSDGIRAPAAWGCTSSPGPAPRTAGPCAAAASTGGRASTSTGPPPRRRVGRPPRPQCRASQPPPEIPQADPPRARWSRCRTPRSTSSARRPGDRPRAGADRRRPHGPRESWMNPARRTARIAGWFFIATFVTSIPAQFFCYEPVLQHADYILGAGATTRVSVGAFLEVLLAIAGIGAAVVLFPILKRQSEAIALGYVASRVVESTIIAVGIVSVLSIVTPSAGPRRSPRRGLRLPPHRRQVAGRRPRLDVPARARPPRRARQRAAAGLRDVPVGPGAPRNDPARAHRRAADLRLGDRGTARRLRPGLRLVRDRDHPGVPVGVVAGHLPRRQGLPGV